MKSDRMEDFKWRVGQKWLNGAAVTERETWLDGKEGGREGEDETAAASSVLHKAEGQRLSLSIRLSLPFHMTHLLCVNPSSFS